MTEKALALRLSDWLERGNYNHEDAIKAAAELRRLYWDEHRVREHRDTLADEVTKLHAVNAELRNALHSISLAAQDSGSTREGMGLYARAAIAKVEGAK
jgi:hypothetical protein